MVPFNLSSDGHAAAKKARHFGVLLIEAYAADQRGRWPHRTLHRTERSWTPALPLCPPPSGGTLTDRRLQRRAGRRTAPRLGPDSRMRQEMGVQEALKVIKAVSAGRKEDFLIIKATQ